ncbi:MAG TPA: sugar transferase, partial [Pyrinomonadaceae bacterium]|nr:sugar transferase [Pyrinomonadaceae bacterium]
NSLGSLIPSSLYGRAKRGLDLLLALLLLPVALPLLVVAAVAIKRDSPGPVFFTQLRVGYRGEIFRIWKLRTMRPGGEGRHYTEGEDPRITRAGRLLRKYRIDELPQILNILRGSR